MPRPPLALAAAFASAFAVAVALAAPPAAAQPADGATGDTVAGPALATDETIESASLTGNPFFSDIPPIPPIRPGTPGYVTAAPALVLSDADRALIDRISAYHSAIHSMVGRFEQIDQFGGRLGGVFWLNRPDHVRFRYDPPSYDEILSTGRGFYVVNRKERTRSVYPQEQVPLRQFLTDHIDLLSANVTAVVRTDEMVSISLADDTPIGKVEVTLIFELATNDLRQWSLTEPNGEKLTFSVYDVIKDIDIPDRYFNIDPNLLDANRSN